jgi:exonuclease III
MAGSATYFTISILNVNGPNSPIKRHQLSNWIKKEDLTICCLQEAYLADTNKHFLE